MSSAGDILNSPMKSLLVSSVRNLQITSVIQVITQTHKVLFAGILIIIEKEKPIRLMREGEERGTVREDRIGRVSSQQVGRQRLRLTQPRDAFNA